jgi:gamma-glutamyltranspeptidase/glutathione hydrolase
LLEPGDPFVFETVDNGIHELNDGHTTHISVVDFEGNAVSLTQTLGLFFGCGVSVDGVLFNSSMSIFYEAPVANRMEPLKRPASTICPTMIMQDSSLVAVLGTPGGANIFNTMLQVILYLLDFNLNPLEAMDASRFSARISREHINFESRFNQTLLDSLSLIGHTIRLSPEYNKYMGGVQLIFYDQQLERYIGVSDKRRDGAAIGYDN